MAPKFPHKLSEIGVEGVKSTHFWPAHRLICVTFQIGDSSPEDNVMNVSLLRERENSLRGANGRLTLAALLITSSAAHADLDYSTSFDAPEPPGLRRRCTAPPRSTTRSVRAI